MIKISNKKLIEVSDWNKLIQETYGKAYSFQQQDGCKPRGIETIQIPDELWGEDELEESIPEVINGEKRIGIKFDAWLKRDPKTPLNPTDKELDNCNYYWGKTLEDRIKYKNDLTHIRLFWERNFYPHIQTIANDLYEKGLIEKGIYSINIDW